MGMGLRRGGVRRGSGTSSCPGEGGFALALVVLLLFAVAMLGAAGYQMLRMETFQAQQSAEMAQALAVADGGLRWFIGSQLGPVPDSASFDINGGAAAIRTRKVASLSPEEDLYLVTSEGIYTDPRFPQVPARRRTSQFAVHRKVPFRNIAPLVTTHPVVMIRDGARVSGQDQAPAGACPGAPAAPLGGVVARNQVQTLGGGMVQGAPPELTLGTIQNIVDTLDLDWTVLTDSTLPVDFDDTWPSFSSLPSDSFPVVRVNGDLTVGAAQSGRGLLIVTGTLAVADLSPWRWDGIVVTGAMSDVPATGYFDVYGTLLVGPAGSTGSLSLRRGNLWAHSCNVLKAGEGLAHLVPRPGSWWEMF